MTSRRAADRERDVNCLQHDGDVDGEHDGDVVVSVEAVFGGCGTDTGDLASAAVRRLFGDEEHILNKCLIFLAGYLNFSKISTFRHTFLHQLFNLEL